MFDAINEDAPQEDYLILLVNPDLQGKKGFRYSQKITESSLHALRERIKLIRKNINKNKGMYFLSKIM